MRGLRSRAAILTTVVVSALTAPLPAHAAGTGTPPPSPPPAISAAAPAKGAEAPATPADGPAKPAAAAAKPAAPPPAPASSARPDWLRAKSTPSADEEPAPSGWTASRVMALLLVAGLGGFALFQRRRRRAAAPIPGASGLRVLESARLGPKAYLVTAAVGRRVLVLGVTDQSVSRLAVLRGNAATEAETAREASPANDPTPRP
ncbi:MAG TPA: flagellar biosynthetic protein FliO, partial [Polyangiaceae bacterium]|nr:flagellar biosynthetic protein FliO [Polyangiaceae bacterium]